MKKPKELSQWDFPDTYWVPDDCHMTEKPEASRANFQKLLDNYNNLVQVTNAICEKVGIELE